MDRHQDRPHLRFVTRAWYAAYGSNTDADRFGGYLRGCSEPATPLDDRPHRIDLPLYFAGERSRRWGEGGVAFVGPDRDAASSTLARAWLLPVRAIAEIGAQENGLPLDAAALDLITGDHVAFTGRRYDAWMRCGAIGGVPVVTLTSSTPRAPRRPPGPAYTRVIARGLRATHGLTAAEVAAYLEPRTNVPFATLMAWQADEHG